MPSRYVDSWKLIIMIFFVNGGIAIVIILTLHYFQFRNMLHVACIYLYVKFAKEPLRQMNLRELAWGFFQQKQFRQTAV